MNTNIKSLIVLATAIYFLIGCNNGTTSIVTGNNNPDAAKMSNMQTDTMVSKISINNSKQKDNGLIASMNHMSDEIQSMKMSGNFDIDFARIMVINHQGAIDMSEEEITYGTDNGIKSMAKKIFTNQTNEQSKFKDIIKSSGNVKRDNKKNEHLNEDIDSLRANINQVQMTGNTDKDFAIIMITSYESALKISKDELIHGTNPQLKEMAQKSITDQTKELTGFKLWLLASK